MACAGGGGAGGMETVQPEAFPGAGAMRGELAGAAKPGALERIRRAGEAYPGELTAGLSRFEEMGLEGLEQYLLQPAATSSRLYGLGREELERTLAGEYDPFGEDGEYWQAYQTAMQREVEKLKDQLFARTAGLGKFFGGGTVKGLADIGEAASAQMGTTLAGLGERERERRLGAVPEAMRMTAFEETLPLQRVEAAQRFGALPRTLEQALLDRKYTEWMRQLSDLGIPLDVATGLATYQPSVMMYGTPSGGGGGGEDWVQYAALAATLLSDERLKEKIEPIDNALEKIKQLDGKTFEFITKTPDNFTGSPRHAGLIAQDIEKVLPEAVVNKDGVMYVKYEGVIALLVNAVKELAKEKEQ